ncbi:ankyrin repeat-containing protein ITN1 isoform X2 [Ziziphus jujuba]|uniref:Ankyrin repeat-containing protein ITN1 isoform X2 n=1 Tax=Ziziphus jujuba TaxID=326968 RepID=A0ABM4AH81_ZIZJJ|nr:ankyrin repeat-containing protein ITN1 isoform X2 [Ziziphus jujuba]
MSNNMGVIPIPSSGIVPEGLMNKLENYEQWSIRLRTYLKAQDVWDVIESTPSGAVDYQDWNKKNATALLAIHISCGPRAFEDIKDIHNAKQAWDTLASKAKFPIAQEISNDRFNRTESFYNAVRNGDKDATNEFIAKNPGAVNEKITYSGMTALHVAAINGRIGIVETLLDKMSNDSLKMRDAQHFTALEISIVYNASIEIAECMVKKDNEILGIARNGMVPAALAFRYSNVKMGRYLYTVTPLDKLKNSQEGATLVSIAISMEIFDIHIKPDKTRQLTNNMSNIRSPEKDLHHKFWSLQGLALKSVNMLGLKDIYKKKLAHVQILELLDQMCAMTRILNESQMEDLYYALCRAIDHGNVEFITRLLEKKPELVEKSDASGRNIFMLAILHRQANIFELIRGFNSLSAAATAVDRDGNTALHMAGILSSPCPQLDRISGAALKMQRELQWFEEVKKTVPVWATGKRNSDSMTPDQMFSKYHEKLMTEGEKWMKDTATSCTVVGALIITIMFAAAFTVPGGNNEDTGLPIFLNKKLFMVFIISDAISLFLSTTSVLMFLGILTSRYEKKDFLKSLPDKMMIGLSTLFVSIAAMMVAFCATLLIVLREYSWIFIPVVSLAIFPIVLFALMQFPLLFKIFDSTYGGWKRHLSHE